MVRNRMVMGISAARALLLAFLSLSAAAAAAFPAAPYFPLPNGATWTYAISGGGTEVLTVVGTATFNGASVRVMRSQAGDETYYTNDASGIRYHGAFFADPGGADETDTYMPPIGVATADVSLGMPVNTSGSVLIRVVGSDDLQVSYNSASTPLGIETVTVPAGTFTNALHVRLAVTYPELLFTQTVDTWVVPGIGPVKETSSDPFTGQSTRELVSYSVPAIVPRRGDFSGDGRSDILWRNTSTGENYLYPMNGIEILAGEGYLRSVTDQNWQVAGLGDFDGDGRADILWRNSSTGENYVYFMNGVSIVNEGFLRTVPDQNWQVAGVGDFNGDGKSDILWRNASTGENYVYQMNGTLIIGEGYLRTVADLDWKVAGVGDFDGSGRADILWRHATSGDNYLYLMNGLSIAGEDYLRTVADTTWEVKGVGDLDGDGRADIVWRNSASGENYAYLMNGVSIVNEGYLRAVADPTWQIAALGDYDGDGKTDILWRNASSGDNYLYPMDGLAIRPSEGYVRSVPPGAWMIIGK
jgi:hypothetical protein